MSRRSFIQAAGGALALGAGAAGLSMALAQDGTEAPAVGSHHQGGRMGTVRKIKSDYPATFLRTFNPGKPVPDFAREKAKQEGWPAPDVFYEIHAADKEIEIAPGVYFPAWAYGLKHPGSEEVEVNVPGPTLRCTEGDEILIRFRNQGSHPHTIHFHGVHEHRFDGTFPHQFVHPGQEDWLRFRAEPYGLHLYHCHSIPLKRHIHKGLYGTFIVDPHPRRGRRTPAGKDPQGRPQEYVMVMNGFDTNFDGDNEVYAINSAAFYYKEQRIPVTRNTLIRVYLVNVTEFDPVNSFHIHANFYYVIRTGTRIMRWGNDRQMEKNKHNFEFTDTIMMCQGERAILEMKLPFKDTYMFHAHQSEFAELGWMGLFQVEP